MKKFECKGCGARCVLITTLNYKPNMCFRPEENWQEVKEEAAENESPAKALPDWCKVGAIGYDNQLHEYFKIINIDNDTVVATRIESSGYNSYQYFNEVCSEARKRPFNADEMKALVGKRLEAPDGVDLIFSFDKRDKTIETNYACYDSKLLMEKNFTIDGKPCYVLEHINERGEWVK